MKLNELGSKDLDFANAKWLDATHNGARGLFVDLGNYVIDHRASKFGDKVTLRILPKNKIKVHQEREQLTDRSKNYLKKAVDLGYFKLDDLNEIKAKPKLKEPKVGQVFTISIKGKNAKITILREVIAGFLVKIEIPETNHTRTVAVLRHRVIYWLNTGEYGEAFTAE